MRGKSKDEMNNSIMDLKAMGEQIKQRRIDCSFTQQAVADACNIKRSYLSEVEKGTYSPSLITMVKIASVIGYDLNDLKRVLLNETELPERNRRVFMKEYNKVQNT